VQHIEKRRTTRRIALVFFIIFFLAFSLLALFCHENEWEGEKTYWGSGSLFIIVTIRDITPTPLAGTGWGTPPPQFLVGGGFLKIDR
jgi:hypothetical protein